MRRITFKYVVLLTVILMVVGCKALTGPDRTGAFNLSSQLFGTDSYYLFGYAYEQSEFYKYPYQGERLPDIINEAFRVIEGGKVVLLPGFNTTGQKNGFALVEEFENLEGARSFYEGYSEVQSGLQFETVSDTVELYQVWVQQTEAGNYVKLLVKDIQNYEGETGSLFNEISLEYTYQPNGSTSFPD